MTDVDHRRASSARTCAAERRASCRVAGSHVARVRTRARTRPPLLLDPTVLPRTASTDSDPHSPAAQRRSPETVERRAGTTTTSGASPAAAPLPRSERVQRGSRASTGDADARPGSRRSVATNALVPHRTVRARPLGRPIDNIVRSENTMHRRILWLRIVLDAVVLLGRLWPAGAPPFARAVSILFLVPSLGCFARAALHGPPPSQ